MGKNGRVFIPAAVRKSLDCQEGVEIIGTIQNGVMHLSPLDQAINNAKHLVKTHSKGASLVDQLIKLRRQEAESE